MQPLGIIEFAEQVLNMRLWPAQRAILERYYEEEKMVTISLTPDELRHLRDTLVLDLMWTDAHPRLVGLYNGVEDPKWDHDGWVQFVLRNVGPKSCDCAEKHFPVLGSTEEFAEAQKTFVHTCQRIDDFTARDLLDSIHDLEQDYREHMEMGNDLNLTNYFDAPTVRPGDLVIVAILHAAQHALMLAEDTGVLPPVTGAITLSEG